jgi:hypothetical protein
LGSRSAAWETTDEPLVMFYKADDAILLRDVDEFLVMFEELSSGLREEDMAFAFEPIERDRVMSTYCSDDKLLELLAYLMSGAKAYCRE